MLKIVHVLALSHVRYGYRGKHLLVQFKVELRKHVLIIVLLNMVLYICVNKPLKIDQLK